MHIDDCDTRADVQRTNPYTEPRTKQRTPSQVPGFSCSDFTPRAAEQPIPYAVPASAWPVPYRLTTEEERRALAGSGEL